MTEKSSSTTVSLPTSCDPPSEDNPPQQAVWVIFGASGHVGGSLVRKALSHGDKVVAIGQSVENTLQSMTGWHERCLGLLCDVRIRESVVDVVKDAIAQWGRIDIIANCTGFGIIGAAEDQTPSDLYNQFSTNFLGTLHILQASLTYFRTNSIPGRYIIFSSTSGALGVPGLAPYCATKYAVEGLIESMLYEVHTFGIKATLVEPGHIRNDDYTTSLPLAQPQSLPPRSGAKKSARSRRNAAAAPLPPQTLAQPPPPSGPAHDFSFSHFSVLPDPSAPYASPHHPAAHAKRVVQWISGRQPTSAGLAAELVWQLGHCAYPPLRLLLGMYAVDNIRDRLKSIIEEIEDWKGLNFPVDGQEEKSGSKNGDGDADVRDDEEQEEQGSGDDDDDEYEQDAEDGDEDMQET